MVKTLLLTCLERLKGSIPSIRPKEMFGQSKEERCAYWRKKETGEGRWVVSVSQEIRVITTRQLARSVPPENVWAIKSRLKPTGSPTLWIQMLRSDTVQAPWTTRTRNVRHNQRQNMKDILKRFQPEGSASCGWMICCAEQFLLIIATEEGANKIARALTLA